VTAFGKLIRTTAFRLTLVYLFLCAVRRLAARLFRLEHAPADHRADHRRSTPKSRDHRASTRGRLRGLVFTIENRALRPGANLYLVTTPPGRRSPAMSARWRPA
jgi:hypothetical protein